MRIRQQMRSRGRLVMVLTWSALCVCRLNAATEARDMQCNALLREALAATNPDTRKEAVQALSLVAARFVPLLQSMLEDKDVQVRLAVVDSLSDVKSTRATAALRMAL